jgi:hypothetical protein
MWRRIRKNWLKSNRGCIIPTHPAVIEYILRIVIERILSISSGGISLEN